MFDYFLFRLKKLLSLSPNDVLQIFEIDTCLKKIVFFANYNLMANLFCIIFYGDERKFMMIELMSISNIF